MDERLSVMAMRQVIPPNVPARGLAAACRLAMSLALLLAAAPAPVSAQSAGDRGLSLTVYVQQAFPKQTTTNKQIDQINEQLGTHFDTWDDIANLSIGVKFFKKVSPYLQAGLEWDYGQGGLDGRATVETEAGPARASFKQHYSIYTDLMLAGHFLPCPSCQRVIPFVLAGGGIGYERDTTTLTLRNDYIDQSLRVKNSGTFPVWTFGVGSNIAISQSGATYLELGVAYYWARLKHYVDASGELAPAPRVLADNDTTGPNYWLGIGWRF